MYVMKTCCFPALVLLMYLQLHHIYFQPLLVPLPRSTSSPLQTVHTLISKNEDLPTSFVTQISALGSKSSLPSWKPMVQPIRERTETSGWLSLLWPASRHQSCAERTFTLHSHLRGSEWEQTFFSLPSRVDPHTFILHTAPTQM